MILIERITRESNKSELVRTLFAEYAKELDENLCFQSFDKELEDPFYKYAEPSGSIFVAYYNGEAAGCVALQQISREGACEMKRLYVRAAYRKFGIGEKLVTTILEDAKSKQYRIMVLDTLDRLQAAIRLYQRFGFKETSAYYANPLPGVVYMEKDLSHEPIAPAVDERH